MGVCRPVDERIFESAPWRFVHTVDVPASAARTFSEALEDGAAWPQWFPGIREVRWTSPQPFGVGTTRTVVLNSFTVQEHFFRWEPGRRFSFYATHISMPVGHVLAEDWLLTDTGPNRCRFTYTTAMEPSLFLRLATPISRAQFNGAFKEGARGLAAFMAQRP
jgi:hypothetical protein